MIRNEIGVSVISRVDFEEPLVTLRTLLVWLPAGSLPAAWSLPADALSSLTGACSEWGCGEWGVGT